VSGDILIKNTGKIKKLTGNDEVPAEFKFKTPFKFPNHAKLIFSFNEIPEIEDTTDAFFRRPIIISFTRQFFGDKEDPHLFEKLSTPEEFSGLLHEVLGRLPRIISQGIRPTTNENIQETYEKYIRSSNPIQYFRQKSLQLTNNPEDIVSKDIMYDSFLLFCRANKIATQTETSFSRKLTGTGFENKQLQRNRKRDYYWIGVKIVDSKKVEDEGQQTFEDLTDEQLERLKWK
jgi:putative DNA primase/helicase